MNTRFIFAFLVTIALVVLILFLMFSGGGSAPSKTQINLIKYINSGSTAQILVDGPINAEQNHQQLEIDVSAAAVTLTIFQGYQRNPINTQTYPNNTSAYAAFIYGLQRSGFTRGNSDEKLSDERGYCVTGNRYIYTFNDGSKDLFRYWSTSCGQATFKGNISTVQYLFQNQVPDYSNQTRNLQFSF